MHRGPRRGRRVDEEIDKREEKDDVHDERTWSVCDKRKYGSDGPRKRRGRGQSKRSVHVTRKRNEVVRGGVRTQRQ